MLLLERAASLEKREKTNAKSLKSGRSAFAQAYLTGAKQLAQPELNEFERSLKRPFWKASMMK